MSYLCFLAGLGSSLSSRHSTDSKTGCECIRPLHTKSVSCTHKIIPGIMFWDVCVCIKCLFFCYSNLLAMAFITYILLAGMALGIQKR